MAHSSRRPAPIATSFSRGKCIVDSGAASAGRERFDDRTVQIVTLVSAIGLLGLIDSVVFEHVMWNAIRDEIAPLLYRLQWTWSLYWRRDA